MFKLKFKKLSKLLKNNKLVPESVRKNMSELANIEIFLQKNLPDGIKNHCFPLNISNMELTLMVESPAIHSKLRFILPMIEETFRQNYPLQINSIKIKVYPKKKHQDDSSKKPARRPVLSDDTRSHLQSMANEMEESDLKDALNRLSKNRPQKR